MNPLCCLALSAQLLLPTLAAVPGHVEAWGFNLFGQAVPPPGGLSDIVAIAAGLSHNLALRTNGTVVAWGFNGDGQTDVPPGLSNVVAISARTHSVALKADGTVVCWGSQAPAVLAVPAGLTNVIAISAGRDRTVALRPDGTVIGWGIRPEDALTPPGLDQVVQVSAGPGVHTLALRSNGTVAGWGGPNLGNPDIPPPGLTNLLGVRAGQVTSFVIRQDRTLFKWGGSFDSNDIPAGVTGIADVQLGFQHVLALRTNGTVLAWGLNGSGQGSVPPGLTGVQEIGAGGNHNLVLTARPLIRSITAPLKTSQGGIVNLSVDAAGEPLAYQWQRAGTNLPGQTSATLGFRAQLMHGGQYVVVVSNPHGVATASTSVSFELPPPVIRIDPGDLTLYRGESAVIRAIVTGLAPFNYQWSKDGAILPGETGLELALVARDGSAQGGYHVRVTDAAGGAATSILAIVTVIDPRLKTIRLRPSLDTSIHSVGVNPRGQSTLLAGARGRGSVDRALLRFDLSSVPAAAVIAESSLRLVVVREPPADASSAFELHRLLKPWDASVNWTQASADAPWSAAGGAPQNDYLADGSSAEITPDNELIFADLSAMVEDLQAWLADPSSNHGWMLFSDREDLVRTARHFGSNESSIPPELTLEYLLPAGPPELSARAVPDEQLELSFQGSPGWYYELQFQDDLRHSDWTALTNLPAGAATAPIHFRLPETNAHRYFRARVN